MPTAPGSPSVMSRARPATWATYGRRRLLASRAQPRPTGRWPAACEVAGTGPSSAIALLTTAPTVHLGVCYKVALGGVVKRVLERPTPPMTLRAPSRSPVGHAVGAVGS